MLGTPRFQSTEKRTPFSTFIITFLSSYRWGFLSGFSAINLKQLCHTVLRIRGQPVGVRPDYGSQHPESKKSSVQMFCCNIGSQPSHVKPFQPEPPFTLSAQKSVTMVSNPRKGSRGSELESPLFLKAWCQGIKQTGKFQNAKPTQLQFWETALVYRSCAGELLGTAGPNWALVWEASRCCRLPGTLLRGEIH